MYVNLICAVLEKASVVKASQYGLCCCYIGFPPGGLDQRGNVGGGGPEVGPPFMMEDLDPLATRSLFVGNIPKHISVYELRDAFLRYGNVLVSHCASKCVLYSLS